MRLLRRTYPAALAVLLSPLHSASAFAPSNPLRARCCPPSPAASKMSASSADAPADAPADNGGGVDLKRAKSRIASAISVGAPAYNAGSIDECAREYKAAAADIVETLPPPLRSALERTLDGRDCEGDDDDAAAWALRKEFDAILEYVPPYAPAASPGDDLGGASGLEPFTDRQLPSQPLPVLDNVMGGMSFGRWDADSATFRGTTSLANNGGFASLRWRFNPVQNWTYAKGIYLKVRHSNPGEHTFRLILKDTTCEMARGANFKTVFCNEDDAQDRPVFIPFEAFDQMEQMGRPLQGPVFNPAAVTELGLMAIKPSIVGDFELKIEEW
eukprot:CAMPEP_0113561398 /NCGR_PEP_ID=MMETSP0015_2-20120614/19953_1 /TAXON_ID=2838 /ORGANISM="Odontella" /LENGTH=328 /DNA_ID=CAMNT_0000463187 /DNA_START=74 /DNA_END=1057 /DNA_ORIENTATION=+ /assembly_acc=CAM_ASM_000160